MCINPISLGIILKSNYLCYIRLLVRSMKINTIKLHAGCETVRLDWMWIEDEWMNEQVNWMLMFPCE